MPKSLNPVLLPGDPSTPLATTPKQYVDVRAVPPGGMVGQALVKVTADDYDYAWADQTGSGTGGGGGPHGHVQGEITSLVADLAALDGRIDALEEAPDPVLDHGALTGLGDDDHPHYLTQARADLRYSLIHSHNYDPTGTAAGAVSAHEALADPHSQYQTQTEGDARYVLGSDPRLTNARTPVAHNHPITDITGLVVALDGKEDDGTAAAAVTDHEAATNPHVQYLTAAEGDAAYDSLGAASAARTAHEAASDPHPGYLTTAEGNAAYSALAHNHAGVYDPAGTAAAARTAHEAAADPHPSYLTLAEGDAAYEALGAVTAHAAATDPHPTYLTQAEGDGRYSLIHSHPYDGTGTAAAAVTAHEAASNPHPVYLTQTEADALYPHAHPYEAAGAVAAHAGAADPHPGYLTQTEGDARYVLGSDGRLTNARTPTAHADSHGVGESDDLSGEYVPWANVGAGGGVATFEHTHDYDPSGTATDAVTTHVAALDPHEQYLTEADAQAEFALLGHGHTPVDLSDYVRRTGTQTLANAFVFNGAVSVPQGTVAAHAARRDDPRFVPAGGTTGQALAKVSNTDHALEWASFAPLGHNHDAAYDAAGAAAAARTAHEAASDPHPAYLTSGEGDAAYAALSHNHNASAINAGTLGYNRLPVGTTASTVAAGDDTRLSNARTPTAHVHGAADVSSGTLAFARIPTGTTSTTVAVGDHTHAGNGGGGGGFAAGIVPATSTTPTVTHGLGTRDLIVSVREVATDLVVRVATETIDDNEVRFTFTTQPTAGQYRYTILSAAATLGTGAHSHAIAEVTGLGDSLADKAADDHTHVIGDTTSLQSALDGKADTGHTHSGYAAIGHDHATVYSAIDHTHTPASIGAAATSHTHDYSTVYSALGHSHSYAAVAHNHAAADVNSGTLAFARIPTGTSGSTVAIGDHGHSGYLSGVVPIAPVDLVDAATIATDASAGNHFRTTVGGNRNLGTPSNPTDGQRALWEFTATGAQRVITLPFGSNDTFESTAAAADSTLTIPNGKTGVLGAIYSFGRRRWTVLAMTVTA